MKVFQNSLSLLTVAILSSATSALATSFDLTYIASTPDATTANGEVDVDNGLAVSGYLDVTAGPDVGTYTLVAGSGTDQSFIYDNFVFPGSDNGFVDTTAGLLWSVSGQAGNSSEVNMWFNSSPQYGAPGDTYSLWGAPGNWNLESYGDATLTQAPQVFNGFESAIAPDGGPTVVLLAAALSGLASFRRKLK